MVTFVFFTYFTSAGTTTTNSTITKNGNNNNMTLFSVPGQALLLVTKVPQGPESPRVAVLPSVRKLRQHTTAGTVPSD